MDEDRTMGAADDHLTAAENYLVIAEEEFQKAYEIPSYEGEATLSAKLDDAVTLADLHRKLAETYWGYPREVTSPPPVIVAPDPDARMREQVAADVEAYQGETLRPGTDSEPDAGEGDLWTFAEPDESAGVWFWYTVSDGYPARWLMVQHYAQFLRWRDERGTKPNAHTWGEIAEDTDGEAVLRRPTAEERQTFYGPEPDPAELPPHVQRVEAAVAQMKDRDLGPRGVGCFPPAEETTPPIALDSFTNRTGTSLDDLGDRELELLVQQIQVERARRTEENGHDPLPEMGPPARPWKSSGGAGQWNG